MYIKNDKTTIYLTKSKKLYKDPILFIHGFTGTSKSWNNIRDNINNTSISIDLPGHGNSKFNNLNIDYDYKDFRSELYLILNSLNIEKLHLCGYSMGGRLAIAFAQKFPEKIKSLILESSSLGIKNFQEKEVQYQNDVDLSKKINQSIENFIKDWQQHELFLNQKKRNIKEYRYQNKIRLSQNPKQLSKSILSFSKGIMPAFEDSFNLFNFPIYLINGADDTKYIKINRDMMKINKTAKQFIVDKASHNIHLENPYAFINIINEII